jgi:uncharacterized protein (DUF1810 family)
MSSGHKNFPNAGYHHIAGLSTEGEKLVRDFYQHYNQAAQELSEGAKEGHWMWYMFGQLKGLGQSSTSKSYGLNYKTALILMKDEEFRRDFLALVKIVDGSFYENKNLFGSPTDTRKFWSSVTLFGMAYAGIFNDNIPQEIKKVFKNHGCKLYGWDSKTLDIIDSQLNKSPGWMGAYVRRNLERWGLKPQ